MVILPPPVVTDLGAADRISRRFEVLWDDLADGLSCLRIVDGDGRILHADVGDAREILIDATPRLLP
ncbi:MAG TPA: hypothetical protein VMT43_03245 [Acidimicrobiales bacterium]|nr:hypothetical protein [Acidimicrobiales bacterium]